MMMIRDGKFLDFLPSQQAAASLMMAINLSQARCINRATLKFRYVSPEQLTDIIREANQDKDIVVGNPNAPKGFLHYPIAWSKHMQELTGL